MPVSAMNIFLRGVAGSAGSQATKATVPSSISAAQAPTGKKVNDATLAGNVDLVILVIILFFFLFRLPRMAFRYLRKSEWTKGLILRSVQLSPRMQSNTARGGFESEKVVDVAASGSDDSHYTQSNDYLYDIRTKPMPRSHPPHLASAPPFARPLVSALRRRVLPGVSLEQAIITLGYMAIMIYHAAHMSNPFSDPTRLGFVAVAQAPWVFAFAQKNSVVGWLVAVGYEKLNFLHRFVGRGLILAANVHALGYTYKWLLEKNFQQEASKPQYTWGFIALLGLDLLFFTSLSQIRKIAYNVFIASHIIGFLLFLVAVCYHERAAVPYVEAAVVLLIFDYLVRFVRTRYATATVRAIPELSLTRVDIPTLNSGWRAGQHVRLRVFSGGMGWLGWAEVHPFTIASASETNDGLVLMCKKVGRWTSRLYEVADTPSPYSGKFIGQKVSVMIEGPYGGPGNSMFASYSAALFVAGGSGITFGLSAIQELVQQDIAGTSRVRFAELVWVVQDESSLEPMLPLFTALVQSTVTMPVRVSVFYTRAARAPPRPAHAWLHPALSLGPGRPPLARILDVLVADALAPAARGGKAPSGVVVGVCGPPGLGDDVSRAVGRVSAESRDAVGGVELHRETFGW